MNVNKGLYIEELINRTIEYYRESKIAFFEKRNLPIRILKKINNFTVVGKLLSKSYVDYFGFHEGVHYEFEAKETSQDYFDLTLIKKHQLDYLLTAHQEHCVTFLIIHFFKHELVFVIPIKFITDHIKSHSGNKVILDQFLASFQPTPIQFPGIIDFVKEIKKHNPKLGK